MLCGYPPFNGSRDDIIIKTVLAGKYSIDEPEWSEVSNEAKDLVSKLLCYNPNDRISAFDALKHPWITKYADSDRVDKIAMKRTLQNLQNFRVSAINQRSPLFNFRATTN